MVRVSVRMLGLGLEVIRVWVRGLGLEGVSRVGGWRLSRVRGLGLKGSNKRVRLNASSATKEKNCLQQRTVTTTTKTTSP